ncbi:protein spaetzle 5-like [Diorhabda carinulata]|uniref:protein spaetzle 5-like n=1 Tax=Diorhabda sublineata TaxID=1163346 RepID=UPI0024E0BDF2|nr:protein spaetzle 5-like [Diorhabda sublineata]XP_057651946.1 protein spaetzle 5-like [Diorhabda carinulata]
MHKIAVIIFCVVVNTLTVDCGGGEKCIDKICYSDPSYPLKEIEQYWHFGQTALTSAFGNPKSGSGSMIKSTTKTCELCPTIRSMKIQPLSIIEDGNQKLYIISTEKYPRPQIEIHICRPHSECNISDLPDDYVTRCVQRNSQMNVLAYNASSRQFVGKTITFPSHCECLVSVYAL